MKRLVIALCLVGGANSAGAADYCGWLPREMLSRDVQGTYLLLRSPNGQRFGIFNSCVTLQRNIFRSGRLNFYFVNRFPGAAAPLGVLHIKSLRTFSSAPSGKISLSRDEGWFLRTKNSAGAIPASVMDYEPFAGGTAAWNAAHDAAGTPEELATRLRGMAWHSYGASNLTASSTDNLSEWKLPDTFDQKHDVATLYLLRFDINKTMALSELNFNVGFQSEVKSFVLRIYTNADGQTREYRFVVQ